VLMHHQFVIFHGVENLSYHFRGLILQPLPFWNFSWSPKGKMLLILFWLPWFINIPYTSKSNLLMNCKGWYTHAMWAWRFRWSMRFHLRLSTQITRPLAMII